MPEIAVYGGTFDPPTKAHENIIDACLEEPTLDAVWVMPSGKRADKPEMQADDHRLDMLNILRREVFHDNSRLIISDFEMNLPQPTQTMSTVSALKTVFPEHRFYFVFGADSYLDMPNWRGGADLQKKLGLLLVPRAGYRLPQEAGNIRYLKVAHDQFGACSSTEARQEIKAGQKTIDYINPGVRKFIMEHGLYT